MVQIREATADDAGAITRLFTEVYGQHYAFADYYDPRAIAKMVHDDDQVVLVADLDGQVVGTASALLSVGDHDDLIALFGRFVVSPSTQGRGVGRALAEARVQRVRELVHFAYGEVRVVHTRNQRLFESLGFTPMGWQPMRALFAFRESDILYAQLSAEGAALRRGHPRIIPEVAVLADTILAWSELPRDAVVDDDATGWPTAAGGLTFEMLDPDAYPRLMRIARIRATGREVFGKLSLSRGLYRLSRAQCHYVVARDGRTVVGGIGWSWDEHDRYARVFELIGVSDEVRGALLAEVDRVAHEQIGAAYVDIDVSAHAPALQRTLERLGFSPVAYLPAMVLEGVERIDVIRMAKLHIAYDPGQIELLPRAAEVRAIVEKALDERLTASMSLDGLRSVPLFEDLGDGERYALARIATIQESVAGTTLIAAGAPTDAIFVLLDGQADIERGGALVGSSRPGEVFGEMGLVQESARSATVIAKTAVRLLRLDVGRLRRLLDSRPRIGHLVMRNLARSLSEKLLEKTE